MVRHVLIWLFILAALELDATAGGQGEGAADESAQVVMDLYRENQELKEQVNRLVIQLDELQRQLAETRSQLDMAKLDGGSEQIAAKPVPEMTYNDITRLRVMDVNRKMKVAVVSGGLRAGMKTGMKFSIMRDDKVIAAIRLVEVRENFAGGLVDVVDTDRFPEVGDRLILSVTQDR